MKKKRLPRWLFAVIVVFGCLVGGAFEILEWPGPDTLVINDTSHTIRLNNCGGTLSDLPPGDVWTLDPGDRKSVGSQKFQKGNVCDVSFDDSNNSNPDACLPLPVKGGGEVKVSQNLKPYPKNSNNLCDAYIKF